LYGRGYDNWRSYESRVNAITVEQLNEVATRYLTLAQRVQIAVAADVNGAVTAEAGSENAIEGPE